MGTDTGIYGHLPIGEANSDSKRVRPDRGAELAGIANALCPSPSIKSASLASMYSAPHFLASPGNSAAMAFIRQLGDVGGQNRLLVPRSALLFTGSKENKYEGTDYKITVQPKRLRTTEAVTNVLIPVPLTSGSDWLPSPTLSVSFASLLHGFPTVP